MAKTREQKEKALQELNRKLAQAKTTVFVDYTGLNVEKATELRQKSKDVGSEYLVVKKTLLKKAVEDNKVDGFDINQLQGDLGVLFGMEDEVAPAKIAKDFSKEVETFKILAGIAEGKFIDQAAVNQLAALPSKEELLAKVVGSINAPISGFVNVLAGNIRKLNNVLKAIAEKGNA